jgi:hypothetical protein
LNIQSLSIIKPVSILQTWARLSRRFGIFEGRAGCSKRAAY